MSRPIRRRRLRTPLAVLVIGLALAGSLRLWFFGPHPGPVVSAPLAEGTYDVLRVVDGDTLLLTDRTRVRLIGSDTPETKLADHPVEPFGPEATRFTEQFIGSHQVQLRFDHERLDQYGRLLAYVYVDGRMLNEALIRAGLARRRTEFHYSEAMKRLFREAQAEAKRNRRGIWSLAP